MIVVSKEVGAMIGGKGSLRVIIVLAVLSILALTTSCSKDSHRKVDADGGDTDTDTDSDADSGTDAGEEDGGTFVPPGPFALEWVVCLDDLGFAYQDYGYGVAVLGDGRIAAAGQVNYPTVSSFLTVFEEDGVVAWSAEYTPTLSADASQMIGYSVAQTESGDVVVTGSQLGTVTLNTGGGSTLELDCVDSWCYFLARYSPDGALLWAFSNGVAGPSMNTGIDVVAAPDDTAVVTGKISGPTVFGVGEPNETVLSSMGAFIARYDADGALLWAKGTTGRDATGRSLVVFEDAGEVAQVGDISPTGVGEAVTFGPGEANEKTIVPVGTGDVVAARYAIEDGALQWVVRAGSADPQEEHGHDAVGHGSDVVLVGGCGGDADFGDLLLEGDYGNGFVASSSPDGDFPWIKGIGWNGWADARGIAADTEGLYVVGHVGGGTAIFGYGEEEETSFSLPMTDDYWGFVARYGFDGALEWAGIIPSADLNCEIHPWAVAVASEDEFVVSGEYWNDEESDVATFGWDGDGNPVTCDGYHDHPFVAKYRVQ